MSEDRETKDESEPSPIPEPDQAPAVAEPVLPLPSPSFIFLAVVSSTVLLTDAVTKYWAETTLAALPVGQSSIVLIEDVLNFHLAYNKGGAFGMLSSGEDSWRGPFFLVISFVAVGFILSLYRRVAPSQRALKWGLPLVLGGALGNLADRMAKGQVVDFVDYRGGWVETMNELIKKINGDWHVTDHWPTFNVADMSICAGVALMAIDMFTSSRASVGEPQNGAAGGATAS